MKRMGKFFNRTHRNLASVMLLALLTACGGDSSTNSDDSGLTVDLLGGASMDFVWIDPGVFMMGSPEDEIYGQQRVTLTKGFYLGTYEVTQGQWEAVMETTPWAGKQGVQSNPKHPAVYVSWEDAHEFISKLNAADRKSLYRMPTEAEWEYAARAGTKTRWSFGDDESQLGNYAWYRINTTFADREYGQPVGTKLPNPWGLYDMHGNVWEYCQDWGGDYPTSAQVNPEGPSTGSNRVIRGGSLSNDAKWVRSAARGSVLPGDIYFTLGFRLVRTE